MSFYTQEESDTIAFEMENYLRVADKVAFFMGKAKNIGERNLELLQHEILNWETIVNLLADYLKERGKLVIIKKL